MQYCWEVVSIQFIIYAKLQTPLKTDEHQKSGELPWYKQVTECELHVQMD